MPTALETKRTVILFGMAYILAFIDRQILSLLVSPIKTALELTDLQFALLNGLAFAALYVVLGLPIAGLADRFPRPPLIAGGIALWSVSTIGCGLTHSFSSLFACRVGVGIGEAALVPAVYTYLADTVERERLGRVLGFFSLGPFIGGALALLCGGALLMAFGGHAGGGTPLFAPWQVCFLVVGLPGLPLAALLLAFVPEPRKTAFMPSHESWGAVLRFIGSNMLFFGPHFIGYAGSAVMLYSMMAWAPAYLGRVMHMDHGAIGVIMGTITGIAGCAGVVASGRLVDRLTLRGRVDAPMIVGAAGMICAAAALASSALCGASPAGLVLFGVAFLFAACPLAPSAVALQCVTPRAMRARVSSIMMLCNTLIGLTGGSILIGWMNDRIFTAPDGIRVSLPVIACGGAILGALLIAGSARFYRQACAVDAAPDAALDPAPLGTGPLGYAQPQNVS